MRRRDRRPPSDSKNSKETQRKSPRRIAPRGLHDFCDDVVIPLICPTCQTFCELNKIDQMQRVGFDKAKPPWSKVARQQKTRCRFFGAGLTISAMISMCP